MGLYSSFIRSTVLPVMLRRDNRQSALKHWRFLEESQWWTRQQLLDYQWQKLTAMLRHAYDTTSYYRQVFDERGLTPESIRSFDDLAQLPVLGREQLYNQMDQLISNRYQKGELQEFTTSGTTAQRAVLYRDQESFNIKLGLQWRHEGWAGRKPGEKIILLWPANMDFVHDPGWKERFKDRYINRQLMFHAGSERAGELRRVYDQIVSYGPRVLKVFPSALYNVVEYLEDAGLRPPKIKSIISTGEPLYPNQRQKFEEYLQVEVFDMYGSREVGNTACEGPAHESLLIAMEIAVVEFVDDTGKPVPDGEHGTILMTDLTNFGAPMIRYKIHDYGSAHAGQSSCGRGLAMMNPAVGRVTDEIWAADGSRHSGHIIGMAVAEGGPFFGQVQIVQEGIDFFRVKLAHKPTPTQEHFDYVTNAIHKLVGPNAEVKIDIVESIPQEKSGKVRFVICKLDEATRNQLRERRRIAR
ncbi:AMP-binding protein [candidate division GN15 bacterium]|nr:AMP-binding protein [candidate division GN15 bacterium]